MQYLWQWDILTLTCCHLVSPAPAPAHASAATLSSGHAPGLHRHRALSQNGCTLGFHTHLMVCLSSYLTFKSIEAKLSVRIDPLLQEIQTGCAPRQREHLKRKQSGSVITYSVWICTSYLSILDLCVRQDPLRSHM